MEYTNDEIFNVTYNTKLNRLEINKKNWTSNIYSFFKKYKLLTIAMLAFIIFSCINIMLIYNFIKVLGNI